MRRLQLLEHGAAYLANDHGQGPQREGDNRQENMRDITGHAHAEGNEAYFGKHRQRDREDVDEDDREEEVGEREPDAADTADDPVEPAPRPPGCDRPDRNADQNADEERPE